MHRSSIVKRSPGKRAHGNEWQEEQKLYNSKHLDELREKALNTEVTKAEDSLFARLK